MGLNPSLLTKGTQRQEMCDGTLFNRIILMNFVQNPFARKKQNLTLSHFGFNGGSNLVLYFIALLRVILMTIGISSGAT